MADVRGLLKDDDFWSVTPGERRQILGALDQDFATLTLSEQDEFLTEFDPSIKPSFLKQLGLGFVESTPAFMGAVSLAPYGAAYGSTLGPAGAFAGGAGAAVVGAGLAEMGYQGLKYGAKKVGLPTLTPPPTTAAELAQQVGVSMVAGPLDMPRGLHRVILPPRGTDTYVSEVSRLADKFNVSLTKSQQTQSGWRSMLENITRRTLTGYMQFSKFDRMVAKQVDDAARNIARQISPLSMKPSQAGALIQDSLDAVKSGAMMRYTSMKDDIIRITADPPVTVTGPIKNEADRMLKQMEVFTGEFKSLLGVEGYGRSKTILEDFARGYKVVKTGVLGPDGKEIVRHVQREIPWSDAWELRKTLFAMTNVPELKLGQAHLTQLTKGIHGALEESLHKVGRSDLVANFTAESARVRKIVYDEKTGVESAIMKALVDEKAYEHVVDFFLTGSRSETTAKVFFNLVKAPQAKNAVKAALWEQIIFRAQKEDVLVSNALESVTKQVRPGGMEEIFGKEHLGLLKEFSDLVNVVSLKPSITKPLSAEAGTLLAMGQSEAATTGLAASVGLFLAGQQEAALGVMGVSGLRFVGPTLLAKMMTSKSATRAMVELAKTPPGTRKAVQLATRLLAIAARMQADVQPWEGRRRSSEPAGGPPVLFAPFTPPPLTQSAPPS